MTVEPLSPAPTYLQSIDMEVGFIRRGHEVAEQYSADEMAHNFIKGFNGIVIAVGEILVFEFHGQNLKAVVKGLHNLELPPRAGVTEPRRAHAHVPHGVLMEKTDVTFIKAADSSVKIKSSARKYGAQCFGAYAARSRCLNAGLRLMLSWRQTSNSRTWVLEVWIKNSAPSSVVPSHRAYSHLLW